MLAHHFADLRFALKEIGESNVHVGFAPSRIYQPLPVSLPEVHTRRVVPACQNKGSQLNSPGITPRKVNSNPHKLVVVDVKPQTDEQNQEEHLQVESATRQ